MKKIYAVLATMLAFSTIGGMTIFADEVQQKLPVELPAEKTGEYDLLEMESQYMTMNAKITSIEKSEKGYYLISATRPDDEIGIVFTIDENTFILNNKDGSFMKADELKNDMSITAILGKKTPMTMSLPPMTNPMGIVVGEENSVSTAYFDEQLTSEEIMLQLNISDETKIVDMAGTKKVFTQDDIKNQNCLVLYGITTRSIPAQTNPVFVMILPNDEVKDIEEELVGVEEAEKLLGEQQIEQVTEPAIVEPETTVTTPIAPVLEVNVVPLREMAEKEGFTVTWKANDKPVVLQKDGIEIEIIVGQQEYKKNGEVLQSVKAPELKNSKIYVSENILQ